LRQQTIETFDLIRTVDVIPNFFTPSAPTRSREEVRHDLGLTDEFLVLHMSNLRPTKRIDLLLRIIAKMEQRDRVRLLILAGGSFASYEPLLDELGIWENVIVQTAAEPVENYLQAADAGLYTSEIESFGLSILETMCLAKPIIAFGVGGIPEVTGNTGLLHQFGDVDAMAKTVDGLIESPELARQIGEAGRKRASAEFTAQKAVPQYEAVYRRVLKR
jgi:L-malate glycosyltransferase